MMTRPLLPPLLLLLAWQAGCGGKGDYCAQVAAVVRPSAAYADATVQEGTALVDTPAVSANGPIAAATLLAGALPDGTSLGADGIKP